MRDRIEPTWWRFVPFALAVLGLISLIAGLVASHVGRLILQVAVVALVVSWLTIWIRSRRGSTGPTPLHGDHERM